VEIPYRFFFLIAMRSQMPGEGARWKARTSRHPRREIVGRRNATVLAGREVICAKAGMTFFPMPGGIVQWRKRRLLIRVAAGTAFVDQDSDRRILGPPGHAMDRPAGRLCSLLSRETLRWRATAPCWEPRIRRFGNQPGLVVFVFPPPPRNLPGPRRSESLRRENYFFGMEASIRKKVRN